VPKRSRLTIRFRESPSPKRSISPPSRRHARHQLAVRNSRITLLVFSGE
jgi:hypothetical protein